ncbi:hypothetical protein KFE25_006504 [Diacronema lutheri]|uniref:Chloride channel protein n=5 Tax=Diacronema lutheri TaxID=2081491 RepID=A0A8J6CEV6_DIALT|nr:hypothetical protein KFE25_006504 [Diacronema lutheri]
MPPAPRWRAGARRGDELELLPAGDGCAQARVDDESIYAPASSIIPLSRSAEAPAGRPSRASSHSLSRGAMHGSELRHEQIVSKLLRENQELTTTIADLEAEMDHDNGSEEEDNGDAEDRAEGWHSLSPRRDHSPPAEAIALSRGRRVTLAVLQRAPDLAARPPRKKERGASLPTICNVSSGNGTSGGSSGVDSSVPLSPPQQRLTGFDAWRSRAAAFGLGHLAADEHNSATRRATARGRRYYTRSGELTLLDRLERRRAGWGLVQWFRQREARSHDGRASAPHARRQPPSPCAATAAGAAASRGAADWPARALGAARRCVFPPLEAHAGGEPNGADDAEDAERAADGSELDAPARNMATFESYDYLDLRSWLRWESEAQEGHERTADREQLADLVVSSLLMPLLIGLAVGIAAWSSNASSNWLIDLKWAWTFGLLHDGNSIASYPVFASVCVGLSGVAAALALVAPAACGSGIPHIKAVLNGIRVPGALAVRTLVAKYLGIILVVASGMPAGREGPMVHIGAGVASTLLHLHSSVLSWPGCQGSNVAQARRLDEDVHKRDFVSMGAAAGVAAAFNAPIGGVIFALEEVSTHWSGTLTTRAFFAAIVAAGTNNLLVSARHDGVIEPDALVVFGEYDLGSAFTMLELPIFVFIGVCGGLLGALFNALNGRINRWRQHTHSPRGAMFALARGSRARSKVLEVAGLALLCATLSFVLPLLFGCSDTSSAITGGDEPLVAQAGGREVDVQHMLVSVQCSRPGEYNEVASITLSNQHRVVRALFSRNASGRLFSTRALALCMLLQFALSVLVYGAAIPSGLFVPCMTIGALGGRLIGELVASQQSAAAAAAAAAETLASQFNATAAQSEAAVTAAAAAAAAASLATADTGFYALVGAAAMLGGVTRMTISLTIIVCEISDDAGALLPLMATILTAKVVADIFNPSIYDAAMALAGFPYIEDCLPRSLKRLRAEDVMAQDVVALASVARARDVAAALDRTTHGAFPVIEVGRTGRCRYLTGQVLRYQLHALLALRAFSPPGSLPPGVTAVERISVLSRRSSRRASQREHGGGDAHGGVRVTGDVTHDGGRPWAPAEHMLGAMQPVGEPAAQPLARRQPSDLRVSAPPAGLVTGQGGGEGTSAWAQAGLPSPPPSPPLPTERELPRSYAQIEAEPACPPCELRPAVDSFENLLETSTRAPARASPRRAPRRQASVLARGLPISPSLEAVEASLAHMGRGVRSQLSRLAQPGPTTRTRAGVALADMLRARRLQQSNQSRLDTLGRRVGARCWGGAVRLLGSGEGEGAESGERGTSSIGQRDASWTWGSNPHAVDPATPVLPPLTPEEEEMLIDLRPIMDLAPLSVLPTTPIDRLHALFRLMGLRHLFVADTRNQLVGVITRKDLLPEVLHEAAATSHATAPQHPSDGGKEEQRADDEDEDDVRSLRLRMPSIRARHPSVRPFVRPGSSARTPLAEEATGCLASPTIGPTKLIGERSLTGP